MMPFRKILLPVDYSESTDAIVPYVKEMVQHFQGELSLVHAYGPEFVYTSELVLADPAITQGAQLAEEEKLRDFALAHLSVMHAELFTGLCDPATFIVNTATSQRTDLIMLPTHGRGLMRRLLLGSVAAKVLHDSSCAVWTGTRTALNRHVAEGYRSVLCAVDQTAEAETVAQAAALFAKSWDTRLSLVHVVETMTPNLDAAIAPYRTELMNAANAHLHQLKSKLQIDAPHFVVDAPIREGVRHECVKQQADVLFLGRGQAQSRVSRLWSDLYEIIRDAPCPVISI